ncbi:MAG: hypothetical protein HDR09_12825 [Lachnospiraceae bacterium]|nr:hypothetical protein [Lachnospiraceae bacterium]
MEKKRENMVDVEYYSLTEKELHFRICPGDLQIVCDVLYDYCNMLDDLITDPPESVDQDTIGLWKSRYEYYLDRINNIRMKIESGIGYSVEKAFEKCRKRKEKKGDDIGEDALVLAVGKRVSKPTERVPDSQKVDEKKVTQQKHKIKEMEQINIFDIMKNY